MHVACKVRVRAMLRHLTQAASGSSTGGGRGKWSGPDVFRKVATIFLVRPGVRTSDSRYFYPYHKVSGRLARRPVVKKALGALQGAQKLGDRGIGTRAVHTAV